MFQWKDEYCVGHFDIDNQHKRLLQLAGELHVAMTAGKGNDVLSACLCSVIAYAKIHFASEERLMQKHQYPEYAQHKEAHDQLAARVVQFQTDLKASRTALNIQLMVVLRDWLTDHIAQNDRKLAEYLRRNAA